MRDIEVALLKLQRFGVIARSCRLPLIALCASITVASAADPPTPATRTTASPLSPEETTQAQALYQSRCAGCHDQPSGRTPPRIHFYALTAQSVFNALTTGVMRGQGGSLSEAEKRRLAVFLAGRPFGEHTDSIRPNLCARSGGAIDLTAQQWNGWGRDVMNTRYQPAPKLNAHDLPRLKLKWAYLYPQEGKANGQPTVIGNRLFVTSESGNVYSLDAQTGCTYWTHTADSAVRTAVSVGPAAKSKTREGKSHAHAIAYFGDAAAAVYGVDAQSGERLWKTKVEEHGFARITGAPKLYGDKLFVPVSSAEEIATLDANYPCCTFRGSIVALNAKTGAIVWKTYAITETPKPFKTNAVGVKMYGPAGAAIWSSPTIDAKRGLLYATTGNSYTDVDEDGTDSVLALDLATGAVRWRQKVKLKDNYLVRCGGENSPPNCPTPVGPDFDFGSSAILITPKGGKDILVAGAKSAVVHGINPDDGAVLWQTRVGVGSALGGVEFGMASDPAHVFAAVAEHIVRSGGEPGIAALDLKTGQTAWRIAAPKEDCPPAIAATSRFACAPGFSAAISAMPGAVFAGALNGYLRAFSTRDGSVLWSFNTAREFEPVNADHAHGGMFDGGGPTIVNGVLYVNSGYGTNLGSGNVLLAFSVDGK